MRRISSPLSASLLAVLLMGATPHAQGKQPPPAPDAVGPAVESESELRDFVERFSTDRVTLLRRYPMEQSPERFARLKKFYGDWQTRLATVNFEPLSVEARIDYVLLRNRLDYDLKLLGREEKFLNETQPLLPFLKTITDLNDARLRMDSLDAQKAASTLDALAATVERTQHAVEAGLGSERGPGSRPRPSATDGNETDGGELRGAAAAQAQAPIKTTKLLAYRAQETLAALSGALRQWYDYYSGYDPLFTWWDAAPYRKATRALDSYRRVLRERVVGIRPGASDSGAGARAGAGGGGAGFGAGRGAGAAPVNTDTDAGGGDEPIVGTPIGREALASDLASEFIPYTPEDLIAIGEREFAWCEVELKKASHDMGFGDDWKAALEKVKTLYVEPGKQPDLIRDLAREAEDYVEKHDLITVPPLAKEMWRMQMMSPQRQKVNPFFTGGETISVSYPTDTMDHEDKMMSMRGNNIHFARATVFHELIPGHELQAFMNARYNTQRNAFRTPFWTEGWSLYWEMLLWDMNFQQSPANRIGMLFWRAHRAARIIFSLNFHLGKWTPQQCIDFLVDKVGHERANAEAEVRRSFNGSYAPLYQLAYMMGGLQLKALHHDLVDSGKMTNRQFHDAIITGGPMPIELVRAHVTKQMLSKDYKTGWKYYGDQPAQGEKR